MPDFIVRIDDGRGDPLNLVLETKGYRGRRAAEGRDDEDALGPGREQPGNPRPLGFRGVQGAALDPGGVRDGRRSELEKAMRDKRSYTGNHPLRHGRTRPGHPRMRGRLPPALVSSSALISGQPSIAGCSTTWMTDPPGQGEGGTLQSEPSSDGARNVKSEGREKRLDALARRRGAAEHSDGGIQSVAERLEEIKPVGPARYPRATPLPKGETRERDEDLDPQIVWHGARIRLTKVRPGSFRRRARSRSATRSSSGGQGPAGLVRPRGRTHRRSTSRRKCIRRRSSTIWAPSIEGARRDDAPDLFADFNGLNDPKRVRNSTSTTSTGRTA